MMGEMDSGRVVGGGSEDALVRFPDICVFLKV